MSIVDQSKVLQFASLATAAGWEWCGFQEAIHPVLPKLIIKRGEVTKQISFDSENFDPAEKATQLFAKQEKKMTLLEKLHSVYQSLDAVEKSGHNKSQNYDYIRAADVTHAIRKQLIDLKVYAEINFDFVGGPFTIAREKAPNAPFSAVLVKCSIVYWDLESGETKTASGLGTGADTGDKSAYKAMTGSLKYALKNSFMVADEADPEADENVDEGPRSRRPEEPDFQDAKRGRQDAPKSSPASAEKTKTTTTPAPSNTVVITDDDIFTADTAKAAVVAMEAHSENVLGKGDAFEGPDDDRMPTEAELDTYRKKFSALGNDLADKGKLKANKGLPAPVKLKTFLLSITKADSPKSITNNQWIDFFGRVDKAVALETGFVGLAKLVNKANGIDDTK